MVKNFFRYMFGPKLYAYYSSHRTVPYQRMLPETAGDVIISVLGIAKWLAIYTSPITLLVLYRRGHFHSHEYMQERAVLILKACACAFCIGYFLRGVGRAMNSAYTEFYSDFIKSWNSRDKQRLFKTYDFEMSHWKTDFVSQARSTYKEPFSMNIFSALLAHTLGRCLMYPGSTSILNAIMQPHLTEARRQMLIEHGGERFYLGTPDGNKIDALLIDRRKRSPGHGPEYLIIGFEGNGGYYELGVLSTVLRKNYSILGWNHPGFGGSTGLPFPPQERNACNTVMDFAINVLGFPPENILLVAWSIGGFTATWAAMTQPNLKGLILDASFDHVMPLALGQFPGFLHPVIKSVIVNYFDLNNTAQLHRYQGPVLFYRRTNDEIICSVPGDLRTNRGNFLIYDFLQYRYPKIFDVAKEPIFFQWLNSDEGSREAMMRHYNVQEQQMNKVLKSHVEVHGTKFPMSIGQNLDHDTKISLMLYLASVHLEDLEATHCTPLPEDRFQFPWDIAQVIT